MLPRITGLALIALTSLSPLSAQVEDGCNAAMFGIDGDLYANGSQFGNLSGLNSTDDWFFNDSIYSGLGLGIIGMDSLSAWNNPAFQNVHLLGGMSLPVNSIINGLRWQDGIYARDFYGGTGNTDQTAFASASKNGESPSLWNPGPMNVTPKNDLIDSYGHLRRNGVTAADDLWLMTGFSRISNSGESYLDIELFSEEISYDPTAGFSSGGAEGGHTAWLFDADGNILRPGDLVLSVVFSTSSVPEIELRIWTSRDVFENLTPNTFTFGDEFDGESVDSEYGYASISTPSGSMVSCGKSNPVSTDGPPWGTLDAAGAFSYKYDTWQFIEIAVNLSKFGIDPALAAWVNGSDPCWNPFGAVLFKARASASFTSQLKDFSGPYPFGLIPEVPPDVQGDTISCYTPEVWLQSEQQVTGAYYHWETPDGNIVSQPDSFAILVDEPGHYILYGTAIQGCSEGADTFYVPSLIKDINVEILADTIWDCSFDTELLGISNGNLFHWTGPNGFSSNNTLVEVAEPGLYILNVQDALSGCWGTDTIYVSRIACEDIDPGVLPFDGNMAVMWDVLIPTFTVPSDVTIDCNADPTDLTLTGDVTDESDNCTVDIGEAVYDDEVEIICGGEMRITRTWLLVDDCGNPATADQIIYLQDTLAPTFDPPADLTLDCSQNPNNVFLTGFPSNYQDNCDPEQNVFIYNDEIVSNCSGETTVFRTWAVQDDCANVAEGVQVITLIDTIAPSFTVPADITLECTTNINDLSFTGDVLDENDNCDGSMGEAVFSDEMVDAPCPNEQTIQRTWRLSDDCGNETIGIQTITLVDTQAPVFTVPADITLDCLDDPTDLTLTGDVTDESDACGLIGDAVYTDEIVVNTPCEGAASIQRTWSVTDACGNTTEAIQAITLTDTTVPVFGEIPNDMTVLCSNIPPVIDPSVSDDCGPIDLVFDETTTNGECINRYTLTRTWTATDGCGNVATAIQVIQVEACNPLVEATLGGGTEVCENEPVILNSQVGYDTPYFQWQFSSDGQSWSDLAGAATDSYQLDAADLASTGWYRLVAADNPNDLTNPLCSTISDSVQLIVKPLPPQTSQNISICDGEEIEINGNTYSAGGTIIDTLVATNGCDSVVTTELIILPHSFTTQELSICDGEEIEINGNTYSVGGTIIDTLEAANGCDSVVTTELTVLPHSFTTQQLSICDGEEVEINGNSYSTGGTIIDTLVAANGCDSVVTTELTILPHSFVSQQLSICDGEAIDINGSTYSVGGTIIDTLTAANGCDSVVTTELTILPHSFTNQELSICDGEEIGINGNSYSSGGTIIDTLVAANGCDSVVTTELTILPHSFTDQEISICNGEEIEINGNTYSIGGTIIDTLVAANGCDSVVTTELTILPHSFTNQEISICDGEEIEINGNTYSVGGTIIDTLVAANGCDSVVTTELTILPHSFTTQELSICDGEEIDINGNTYSVGGTIIDTLIAANGCDSVVTTELTILPHSFTTQELSICDGEEIDINGNTYSVGGTIIDTLVAANGCDSVVTTELTILPHSFTTQELSICDGEEIDINGNTYSVGGTIIDTLVAANGCDSVVTTELTILPHSFTTQELSICDGEEIDINGNSYSVGGTIIDTLVAANGCDSVVTTNLTILPHSFTTQEFLICDGEEIEINGNTYSVGGTIIDTLTAANGCDSVVTTELTILPHSFVSQQLSICDGEEVEINGNSYSVGGTIIDTLVAANGCDSVVTTELIILPHSFTIQELLICDGEEIEINGNTYSAGGTIIDTLVATNGCDSVVTTELIILPHSFTTQELSICDGEEIEINGNTYSVGGTIIDTLEAANGCDSVVTTELTVLPHSFTTQQLSICDGEEVEINGNSYSTGGTIIDTLVAANGCDSVVTTELTILPHSFVSQQLSICDGEAIDINGSTYSVGGTIIDTLTAANGCDSVVTTELTILPHSSVSQQLSICNGETIDINGNSYSVGGTVTDTLAAANGCDSVVTTELTILPHSFTTQELSICDGEEIEINGNSYSSGGTIIDTLVAANGCDSVVATELTILPHSFTTQELSICNGETIDINGNSYSVGGTVIDTLAAANGCDSVVTTELTILSHSFTTQELSICNGETIDINGNNYSIGGTIIDTLVASNGCDSVVTTELNLLPIPNSSQTIYLCEGETVEINDNTYSTEGTIIDTLEAMNGCDSIATAEVLLLSAFHNFQAFTICEGETIELNGSIYAEEGTITDTLTAANGCDSIITTELTVLTNSSGFQTITICEGEVAEINGIFYSTEGTVTDTLSTNNGCYLIVTTELIVLQHVFTTQAIEICDGEQVVVNGQTYATDSTIVDTLVAGNGCDSVVITELTVLPVSETTQTLSLCEGEELEVNGNTYSSSGVYVDVLTAANGCDSIVMTELNILPQVLTQQTLSFCEGSSILLNGQEYYAAGTVVDTLTSFVGCDSMVVTELSILSLEPIEMEATICKTDSVFFGNAYYSLPGIYSDTLVAGGGCDSIVVLEIKHHPPVASQQEFSFCPGGSIEVNGNVYAEEGTAVDTFMAANGCDSIVTTLLTFTTSDVFNISVEICQGDSVEMGGNYYFGEGTYIDTLSALDGCDSIVVLELDFILPVFSNQELSFCPGGSIEVNGNVYTQEGTVTDTLIAVNGCDSIIITELAFTNSIVYESEASICEGDSVLFGNNYYSQAGIYVDTLMALNGCDSIISFELSFAPPTTSSQSLAICMGGSVEVNGNVLTEEGTYVDTLASANGCDSIVTTILAFTNSMVHESETSICEGDSVLFGNNYYSQPGIYLDTLMALNGCDSIVSFELSFTAPVTSSQSLSICMGGSVEVNGNVLIEEGTYVDTLPSVNGCDSIVTTCSGIHQFDGS